MKLTFWGAARTVTGSLHYLELDSGTRLFLDCGLFQGPRAEAKRINLEFPADPATVDAVLLSHAHIDHAGLLPRLWREGFRGTVYATHATRDLCALMLRDSGHIQEKDVEYVNRRHHKKGKPLVEPLYTQADAEAVMGHFIGVPYGRAFRPAEGVEVVYRDAGHILGSATMVVAVEEGGRQKLLGFTGDVGNPGRPILRDPEAMDPCDWLITESTYGGQTHEPTTETHERLAETIRKTARRGGKVIVPAFAVGRTQELVHALDQMTTAGTLPPVPIFVDSPLAVNVTGVYQTHPECYDAELLDYLLTDPSPFGFDRLEYVRDVERSKALNGMRVPMVIISASGMAEAGRILHHLKNNVEDPDATVLIVGYQAEGTLGRKLVDRHSTVNIFGDPYRVRAETVVMNTFSAHADEPGLLDFVGKLDRQRLQTVYLVHGETERQQALQATLNGAGYADVRIPARGEAVAL